MSRISDPTRLESVLRELEGQAQTFSHIVASASGLRGQLEVNLEELHKLNSLVSEAETELARVQASAVEALSEFRNRAASLEAGVEAASIRQEERVAELRAETEEVFLHQRKKNEERLDAVEDFLRGRVRDIQGAIEPLRGALDESQSRTRSLQAKLEELTQKVVVDTQATRFEIREKTSKLKKDQRTTRILVVIAVLVSLATLLAQFAEIY